MNQTSGKLMLGFVLAASMAWGQNPSIIQNTRTKLNAVQQHQTAQSNAALAASQGNQAHGSAVQERTVKAPPVRRPERIIAPRRSMVATAPNAAPQTTRTLQGEAPGGAVAVAEQNSVDANSGGDGKKTYSLTGKRDPFLSPVTNRSALGSGCSVGKKCLAIDQISLRGIVKSDSGMIAVVVNALDKAYFLHENDPVFNGYVIKITGDSIIFKETVQDKLGKPILHEVTKKIVTPAV
jgi:hypothetical protein